MRAKVNHNGSVIEEVIPFSTKRRGLKRDLCVVHEPVKGGKSIWPARPELAVPICLGHAWDALLQEGKYRSANALAVAVDKDPSQIMKYLRTTNLAPDIICSILEGSEPAGLKQDDLLQQMPLDWEEQRRLLGFPLRHGTADEKPVDQPVKEPPPAPPRPVTPTAPAEIPIKSEVVKKPAPRITAETLFPGFED